MLWIIFACTVGSVGPADPNSVSGIEAAKIDNLSKEAGRLANRSRDLERAAKDALTHIADGGDRDAEIANLEAKMKEIEAINAQLQADHQALTDRLRAAAQSTADRRE